MLGISVSTLADYELGNTKVVPVDKVVLMADLYNAPELKTGYCKHECPICSYLPVATEAKGLEDVYKRQGLNILGAHIDSPRLDIKQNPLYEDSDFALLDTHYYGGIKKYQWVTLPLALHGVVAKKDGSIVEINIGENEDDPVFFISDLLIHLSAEQMEKKASKVIEGEALDLIFGSRPLAGEEKEAVRCV